MKAHKLISSLQIYARLYTFYFDKLACEWEGASNTSSNNKEIGKTWQGK